ncbi:MAG: tRNA (guanosine(37)-N1)-methyltransferase TrmD [Pseudomonadota bacterium]
MTEKLSKSHGRKSISASLQPRDLMAESKLKGAWTAKIITLFPEAFPGVLGASLTGKALKDGLWALEPIDLRMFGEGKHRNVDDTPYGGGAGMVLRADIVGKALDFAARGTPPERARWPIVYLSPRGAPFNQAKARDWSQTDGITLLCGRFEGVDQRVLDAYEIEEVSLGDFVLTGGEIAAQAMLDATIRLRAGVLGNEKSTQQESHADGLLEHPHYTRPADWRGMGVPEILTSGDHGKVAEWRRAQSEALTRDRRPDLWAMRDDD